MNLKSAAASIAVVGALAGGGAVVTDNSMNIYTQKGTVLEKVDTSIIPEAGEISAEMDTTKPKVTLKRWDGEVAMSVSYDGIQATGARPFLSKNVEWKEGNQTMQVVPLEKSAQSEDGGYEINVILDSKPASNVFNFSIDGANDLDFFFQPPLTDEEIKEGATRPDNVVGSYAVYYKDHANHIEGQTNYATGKAYHIFRPKVIDNGGNEVWADMSYSGGILSVTVPQTFLDTATYPVIVDPTFGNTVIGGGSSTVNNNNALCSGFNSSISANGTVGSVLFYANLSAGTTRSAVTAIYSSAAARQDPTYTSTLSVNSGTPQWWTTSWTGPSVITSTAYYPCLLTNADGSNTIAIFRDAGSSGDGKLIIGTTYPTWPSSTSFTNTTSRYSIYATYTASAVSDTDDQTDFFQ